MNIEKNKGKNKSKNKEYNFDIRVVRRLNNRMIISTKVIEDDDKLVITKKYNNRLLRKEKKNEELMYDDIKKIEVKKVFYSDKNDLITGTAMCCMALAAAIMGISLSNMSWFYPISGLFLFVASIVLNLMANAYKTIIITDINNKKIHIPILSDACTEEQKKEAKELYEFLLQKIMKKINNLKNKKIKSRIE